MILAAVPLALLLICAVKSDPEAGGLVPPINEDDPELYTVWTTPSSFEFWWRYSAGSEYVGNLFAGRSEFPYIVDIRSIDLDSDRWSTGNLVTSTHVITAGRSLQYLVDDRAWETWWERGLWEGRNIDEGTLMTLEYVGVEVNFCGNYLWEEYKFNTGINFLLHTDLNVFDYDVKDSGTRYARFLYIHPLFKRGTLSYDIGVIKVNFPIRPIPGTVDHMPIWYDNEKGQVTDVDLSNMINQRRVCYVGSYGRNWANHYESYVTDYKVRYRAYFLDIDECKKEMNHFKIYNLNTPLVFEDEDGKDKDNLMCFGTRAKVGAVCDHDRGAPLVCDGRVYGFVVRGANFSNCNNLLPLPFFVQKGSLLNQYYASIIKHVFVPKYRPKKNGNSSTGQVCNSMILFSLFVLLWHSLLTNMPDIERMQKAGRWPPGKSSSSSRIILP